MNGPLHEIPITNIALKEEPLYTLHSTERYTFSIYIKVNILLRKLKHVILAHQTTYRETSHSVEKCSWGQATLYENAK